jgi:hypothetical protein
LVFSTPTRNCCHSTGLHPEARMTFLNIPDFLFSMADTDCETFTQSKQ